MTPLQFVKIKEQIVRDVRGLLEANETVILAAIHNAKSVHDLLKTFSFPLRLAVKLSDAKAGGTLVKTRIGWNVAESVEIENVVSDQPDLAGFREAMGDGDTEDPTE